MTEYNDTITQPATASSLDSVLMAHLSNKPERDFVEYKAAPETVIRQSGVDHPAPAPIQREKKQAEAQPRRPIDPDRTFFVTGGKDRGGIRQTWNRWRLVELTGHVGKRTGPQITPNAVELIWTENKTENGDVVTVDSILLQGSDAFNFLRTVGDSNANLFARPVSRGIQA